MIFIDRSIPRGVAEALKKVRNDVRWLEDEFQHDVKETDWLPEIGKREWLVISRDKKIRTRPWERRALLGAGVGCFIIAQKQHLTRWGYLKLIALTLDEMEELFAKTQRPFIFLVNRAGNLRLIT